MFIINCRRFLPISAALIALIAVFGISPASASPVPETPSSAVETNKVITIEQLTVGAVTVTGNKEFSVNTVLGLLPALKQGQPLDIPKLSSQVVFANNNPALKIAVDVQPVNTSLANIVVRVAEQETIRSLLTFDNTGDSQTGPNRISLAAIDYNWLGKAQTAVLSYTRSPSNDKVNQFGFFDSIPLPKTGDMLTISGSYSNVDSGTVAESVNISGKGRALGAHLTHSLTALPSLQTGIDFGIDYKAYDNVIDFSGSNQGSNVKTLPLSIAYQYTATGADYRLKGDLSFTHNLWSAADGQDVSLATWAEALPHYTIWRQNTTYQKQLNKGWLFNAQLEGQYATTSLIAGEEFGLGGAHSVRGFHEREIAGDKGVRLTTELYTPEIAKGQRLLAFVDQGKYWLNDPQGASPYQSIASYGIGWRLESPGGTSVALDLAKVLKGTDTTPEGSTRLHVLVSQMF